MIFNPEKLLHNGYSEEVIEYYADVTYDPGRPMGNVALSKIERYVLSLLVGRGDTVEPMIPGAVRWIDLAISREERSGDNRDFYMSKLHRGKAIARWLMDGGEELGSWEQSQILGEASWTSGVRAWTRSEIVRDGALDDYMACAWLAGPNGWQSGVEMYERWEGAANATLSGKLTPRKYVYAMLLNALGAKDFTIEKLHLAGRAVLRANLQEEWLGGGQGIRAATWLKLVHGLVSPDMVPTKTLLMAYEDMPDVSPPPEVLAA